MTSHSLFYARKTVNRELKTKTAVEVKIRELPTDKLNLQFNVNSQKHSTEVLHSSKTSRKFPSTTLVHNSEGNHLEVTSTFHLSAICLQLHVENVFLFSFPFHFLHERLLLANSKPKPYGERISGKCSSRSLL